MDTNSTIYVSAPSTFIGAALVRQLASWGAARVLAPANDEVDPCDRRQVDEYFARNRPEYVFVVGGKSGGIRANQKYPAEFLQDNLLRALHTIDAARRHGASKLLYLASSCVYPKHAPQPMRVDSLLTGALEPTNEAYALAKLTGLKLCASYSLQYGVNFIGAIPADPFGPGASFDPEDSHVVAAVIRKMHEAKVEGAPSIELWGTGTPRREFIFVDDLADACIFAMNEYDETVPINLGGGTDLAISELAEIVKEVVGYTGAVRFDTSKPDGMPRKLLDSSALGALGWEPRTPLRSALTATYDWFLATEQRKRAEGKG